MESRCRTKLALAHCECLHRFLAECAELSNEYSEYCVNGMVCVCVHTVALSGKFQRTLQWAVVFSSTSLSFSEPLHFVIVRRSSGSSSRRRSSCCCCSRSRNRSRNRSSRSRSSRSRSSRSRRSSSSSKRTTIVVYSFLFMLHSFKVDVS